MDPDPDEHGHPGEEDLHLDQGTTDDHGVLHPKYSAVSEQARKMISHENLCKLFCGGKTCKYCTSDNWSKEQMAVNGLYSEWITDNILAMARMSNQNIGKFDMINQLEHLQVKTVINLQEQGEHAHCGFGNDKSGFSYNPQSLMDAGIFFYNFAIPDYSVAETSTLLDIVKVMQFAVSQGKVAIHCHAGLGRTGMIIACYLIYNNRVKAYKAVKYVRLKRPGAIQTKRQIKACQRFEQYLQPFFVIFTSRVTDPGIHAVSFNSFLARQRHLLHGYEERKLKHIPKVVYICCERLLELCGKGNALSSLRNQESSSADLESLDSTLTSTDFLPLDDLTLTQTEEFNPHTLSLLQASGDNRDKTLSPSQSEVIRTENEVVDISSAADDVKIPYRPRSLNSSDEQADGDYDDDDDIVYEKIRDVYEQAQKQAENSAKGEGCDKKSICQGEGLSELLSEEDLWNSMIATNNPAEVSEIIATLEERLNKTDKAWQELARERNPSVLCGVICDWLDQLSEPVLRAQDVCALTKNIVDPNRAFLSLEKNTKCFLQYIVLVISKFDFSSERLRQSVLEFFLSYLCQKRLRLGHVCMLPRLRHFDELKHELATQLFDLFLNLLQGLENSR